MLRATAAVNLGSVSHVTFFSLNLCLLSVILSYSAVKVISGVW